MSINKDDICKVASDSYYINADMIKFLLIENLSLKSLLHDKGICTPDEFKEYHKQAAETLEVKANKQMIEHLKIMMESGEKKNGPTGI